MKDAGPFEGVKAPEGGHKVYPQRAKGTKIKPEIIEKYDAEMKENK